MKNSRIRIASCLMMLWSAHFVSAQNSEPEIIPPVKLDGPRVGVTYITPGNTADELKKDLGISPFMTQFGWQFETRYFTLPNGTCGLVEGVLLAGGLEQGKLLPSGSLLIGIRNAKGMEFGFGPNLSYSGARFVLAVGTTLKSSNVFFPINLAVVPAPDGIRISLLTGFNARKQ